MDICTALLPDGPTTSIDAKGVFVMLKCVQQLGLKCTQGVLRLKAWELAENLCCSFLDQVRAGQRPGGWGAGVRGSRRGSWRRTCAVASSTRCGAEAGGRRGAWGWRTVAQGQAWVRVSGPGVGQGHRARRGSRSQGQAWVRGTGPGVAGVCGGGGACDVDITAAAVCVCVSVCVCVLVQFDKFKYCSHNAFGAKVLAEAVQVRHWHTCHES